MVPDESDARSPLECGRELPPWNCTSDRRMRTEYERKAAAWPPHSKAGCARCSQGADLRIEGL